MRIIKEPELPELKSEKYKCLRCDCKFEVLDSDIITAEKDMIGDSIIRCPFCDRRLNLIDSCKQIERIRKYKQILMSKCKRYGYNWLSKDEVKYMHTFVPEYNCTKGE